MSLCLQQIKQELAKNLPPQRYLGEKSSRLKECIRSYKRKKRRKKPFRAKEWPFNKSKWPRSRKLKKLRKRKRRKKRLRSSKKRMSSDLNFNSSRKYQWFQEPCANTQTSWRTKWSQCTLEKNLIVIWVWLPSIAPWCWNKWRVMTHITSTWCRRRTSERVWRT